MEVKKILPDPSKVFVLPHYGDSHYKHEEKLDSKNIYYVKTTVSDLKDEDFAKAAEEYKQKQLAKSASVTAPESSSENRERERERAFESNLTFI